MKKIVGLLALAAATFGAAPAQAQSVTFTGTTLGCFYTAVVCTPVTTSTLSGGSLTFNGGTFNVTTSNGFVGVGNTAGSSNNFGSFNLPASVTPQNVAAGTSFLLHINFTAPSGVSPNPVPFTASVVGSVTGDAQGGYSVIFPSTGQNITWSGGSGTVIVNTASINNSLTSTATDITGSITARQTTVPEPSTVLLVASGLAGLAVSSRRRRTNV